MSDIVRFFGSFSARDCNGITNFKGRNRKILWETLTRFLCSFLFFRLPTRSQKWQQQRQKKRVFWELRLENGNLVPRTFKKRKKRKRRRFAEFRKIWVAELAQFSCDNCIEPISRVGFGANIAEITWNKCEAARASWQVLDKEILKKEFYGGWQTTCVVRFGFWVFGAGQASLASSHNKNLPLFCVFRVTGFTRQLFRFLGFMKLQKSDGSCEPTFMGWWGETTLCVIFVFLWYLLFFVLFLSFSSGSCFSSIVACFLLLGFGWGLGGLSFMTHMQWKLHHYSSVVFLTVTILTLSVRIRFLSFRLYLLGLRGGGVLLSSFPKFSCNVIGFVLVVGWVSWFCSLYKTKTQLFLLLFLVHGCSCPPRLSTKLQQKHQSF